jgi:hypothetical protein
VAAEYGSPDGETRVQEMIAGDGSTIHGPVTVGSAKIAFTAIPPPAYASGELILRVTRRSGPSASVERLVLKETGRSFTAEQKDITVPTVFALEQNYPNPFNGSSEVGFRIAEFGLVTLQVFDLLGRPVAMLVNEPRAPGAYRVRFDGSGLASGVYLYRLTAGSFIQTRKMVYVR